MAVQPAHKRWPPRFSLRTLAILLTIVCLYFACWIPTTTTGVRDVGYRLASESVYSADGNQFRATPKVPLILEWSGETTFVTSSTVVLRKTSYYFWFFGWVAKLPFTTQQLSILGSVPVDPGVRELDRTRSTS
jgi:hypothetical protein